MGSISKLKLPFRLKETQWQQMKRRDGLTLPTKKLLMRLASMRRDTQTLSTLTLVYALDRMKSTIGKFYLSLRLDWSMRCYIPIGRKIQINTLTITKRRILKLESHICLAQILERQKR